MPQPQRKENDLALKPQHNEERRCPSLVSPDPAHKLHSPKTVRSVRWTYHHGRDSAAGPKLLLRLQSSKRLLCTSLLPQQQLAIVTPQRLKKNLLGRQPLRTEESGKTGDKTCGLTCKRKRCLQVVWSLLNYDGGARGLWHKRVLICDRCDAHWSTSTRDDHVHIQQPRVQHAPPPAQPLRSLQEVVLSRTISAGATASACTGVLHPATGAGAARTAGEAKSTDIWSCTSPLSLVLRVQLAPKTRHAWCTVLRHWCWRRVHTGVGATATAGTGIVFHHLRWRALVLAPRNDSMARCTLPMALAAHTAGAGAGGSASGATAVFSTTTGTGAVITAGAQSRKGLLRRTLPLAPSCASEQVRRAPLSTSPPQPM